MRPPPTAVRPALDRRNDVDVTTLTRRYHLITPLLGGGVESARTDPITMIRGSAIRGQLRFWWRATRGGRFNGDLKRMKEAEDLLWGAASTAERPRPSRVQIDVTGVDVGQEFVVRDRRGGAAKDKYGGDVSIWHYDSPYSYVAFPLQPKRGQEQPRGGSGVREDVGFSLTVSYHPPQREGTDAAVTDSVAMEDIEAALWAWETLGGIGARTRRGFGALRCIEADGVTTQQPPDARDVMRQFRQAYQDHVVAGVWPADVPNLGHGMGIKLTARVDDPLIVWQDLIDRYKRFRQDRHGGRGRSKWPEPDEIRRLTGQTLLPRHAQRLSTVAKFPRAVFGLPIIYHFKDNPDGKSFAHNVDPQDTTLKQHGRERLASPLILRPLPCANNRAVGMALVLAPRRLALDNLVLEVQDGSGDRAAASDLAVAEALAINPLHGQADVLQAFLDSLS